MGIRNADRVSAWLALALVAAGCGAPNAERSGHTSRAGVAESPGSFPATAARLAELIEHERDLHELPAVSIALVDGARVAWAAGFGTADPGDGEGDGVPATAETAYRVGSVSKLFTDVAVMRLVERGLLELDAPLARYLPDFAPENPFGGEVTLRMLLAHRSGLVREPPVGHYFDDTGPTLAATVASLNATTLVHTPGTVTKYSNAGIAVAGYVLERVLGRPFEDVVAGEVLEPLGIEDTASFRLGPAIEARLAQGNMWGYDRDAWEAAPIQFGMSPAANLYASVLDLAAFAGAVLEGGRGARGRLLSEAALETMLAPASDAEGRSLPYGVGFRVDTALGRRRAGHGGAVYGFATELSLLVDDGLAVAVVTTLDCANEVTERIARTALEWMLAERAGAPLEPVPRVERLHEGAARALAGTWRADDRTALVYVKDGEPWVAGSRLRAPIRRVGDGLALDGRLARGPAVEELADGRLAIGGVPFERWKPPLPGPPPERWEGLIGEYGWDHDVLFVLERDDGRLGVLIEWFWEEPLEELEAMDEEAGDLYGFPATGGLYPGETLSFVRGPDGRAREARLGELVFPRRAVGPEDGATFRIVPARPVEELRALARAASPPIEEGIQHVPDLVELTRLDPAFALDVRYASTNNFMGELFYPEARAFMQRPAAEALSRVRRALEPRGIGLLVHDAYRPWHVTKMFWDATPPALRDFVADPAKGSRHNRGCAVDLTLCDAASGAPLPTTSGYDEFTARAYPFYPGGTAAERAHTALLRKLMEEHGFRVYRHEWWHFDYQGWERWPLLDLPFSDLDP